DREGPREARRARHPRPHGGPARLHEVARPPGGGHRGRHHVHDRVHPGQPLDEAGPYVGVGPRPRTGRGRRGGEPPPAPAVSIALGAPGCGQRVGGVMAERFTGFTGFPREGIEFFGELATHNDRGWFAAHKDVYERACRAPMPAPAAGLERRLGQARISRINRDMRFSRNRAPYQTYIAGGIGGGYLALSAEGGWAGAGLYKPQPAVPPRFRSPVAAASPGPPLPPVVTEL